MGGCQSRALWTVSSAGASAALAGVTAMLALGACSRGPEPRDGACEQGALAELGARLDGMPRSAQAKLVWPGITAACGRVPGPMHRYFDAGPGEPLGPGVVARIEGDEEAALWGPACGEWQRLPARLLEATMDGRAEVAFIACEFERFGVLGADEARGRSSGLMTFAVHAWILEQGLSPAEARPLSRALYAREQLQASRVPSAAAGLRLPVAHGGPLEPGVVVVVSTERITVGDRTILEFEILEGGLDFPGGAVTDGRITELFRVLEAAAAAPGEAAGTLVIAADTSTPMWILSEVIQAGGAAGYGAYGFVVDAEGFDYGYIPLSAMAEMTMETWRLYLEEEQKEEREERPRSVHMTVELTQTSWSVATGARGEVAVHPRGNEAAVTDFVRALRAKQGRLDEVVLSAERGVPLDALSKVIAAARAGACGDGEPDCDPPKVMLQSGRAHGYDGPGRPTVSRQRRTFDHPFIGEDDDIWGGLTGREAALGAGLGGTEKVRVPRVRQAKAKVDGALRRDIVRRIIRAHINEVRSCYTAGLGRDPELEGKVVVQFDIASGGKVRASKLVSSDLGDAKVGECVVEAAKWWKFPKPEDGGEVRVEYPFALSPG